MSAAERGLRRAKRRLAAAQQRWAPDATILDAKAEVEHYEKKLAENPLLCEVCGEPETFVRRLVSIAPNVFGAHARLRVCTVCNGRLSRHEIEPGDRIFFVSGEAMHNCRSCHRAVPVEPENAWRSHAKDCAAHRPPRPEKPVRAPRVARPRGTSQRPRCEGTGALIGRLEVTKPGENPRVRCPVCSGSVGTSGGKVGHHYARGGKE